MPQIVSEKSVEIGERVRSYRNNAGLTGAQMGEKLHLSAGGYNNKELGKRDFTWDEIIQLADFFHVTLDDLIRGVKPENEDIFRRTGLNDAAMEGLESFYLLSSDEELEAINKAFAYMEVLFAIAELMSFVPKRKGYYLKNKYDEGESVMTCVMSPEIYESLLEQNLLRVLRVAKKGKRPSIFYETLDQFRQRQKKEELRLAEYSEFKGAKKNGKKK